MEQKGAVEQNAIVEQMDTVEQNSDNHFQRKNQTWGGCLEPWGLTLGTLGPNPGNP